ncbi:MAG: hypothetical protein ACJ74S_09140 [Gaiellaceae bacterium]
MADVLVRAGASLSPRRAEDEEHQDQGCERCDNADDAAEDAGDHDDRYGGSDLLRPQAQPVSAPLREALLDPAIDLFIDPIQEARD